MTRCLPCLLAVLLSATPGQAADLYRSDFSAAANGPAELKEWRLGGGQYRIADGWLTVASDRTNPQATLDRTHDGDGTFRATVRNATNCHWAALLARGVYRLEVNNQFGRLGLHRLDGGQWKLVGQAAGYIRYAVDRHQFELRIAFAGDRVYGFLDDKKLIEYQDRTPVPPGGAYGLLGGWGTLVAWRAIRLADQPDLSEWPCEPTPKAAPEGLVEVTWVRGLAENGIIFDGQPGGLKYRLTTRRPAETAVRLICRLVDVRQRVVAEDAATVSLKPGVEIERSAAFTPPARGCFKVALFAGTGDSDVGWVEDLGSFTVLPEAVGRLPRSADSCLGGHMDGIQLERHLRCARRLGIQWARCHDMLQHTWWTRVQPDRPDQWVWHDATQKALDDAGFSTLGEFLWTPRWATSAAAGDARPQSMPPKDMADFARYVAATVGHYRGSIHCWEVWNEPHYSGFWRGTPAQYAELLQAAYREAKLADPGCIVLGGGGVDAANRRWVEQMVRHLPPRCMDAFSIHYLQPEAAAEQLAALRGLLKDSGNDVPIWNTEASVLSSSFLDQSRRGRMEPEARYHFRNACFELVRMYMQNLSNGVRRVFYYELADPWRFREFPKPRVLADSPLGGSMWEEGHMLKPIAAAHAALALAIEGKTFRARVAAGPLQAFVFEGPGGAAAVQYATFRQFARSAEVRLALPQSAAAGDFTRMDFMGNPAPVDGADGRIALPLSREPVYLLYRGDGGAAILKRMYETADFPHTQDRAED